MTKEQATIDLSTAEGIEAAQANLDAFKQSIENCLTRDLLLWDFLIGQRQMVIAEAKQRLKIV